MNTTTLASNSRVEIAIASRSYLLYQKRVGEYGQPLGWEIINGALKGTHARTQAKLLALAHAAGYRLAQNS